jgi:hypothetical protein
MPRVILLVLALCGAARAQPMAVGVEQPRQPQRHHRHPPAGLGIDLAFGWAGQRNGPSGWSARLDYEILPFFDPSERGGLFGVHPGIEVWRSGEDNWGFSLPVGVVGGVRIFPMRFTLGVGLDAILIDQVDDDTGFGLYAPFALAKLGADVFGAQVGADARIGYRWQFGADDHARWQLGIYVGYTMSAPKRAMPIR